MKFNSGKEMLDYIVDCSDLYSAEKDLYVFGYNNYGSIAVYNIYPNQAMKLRDMSEESGEYWGAFLGAGGSIYDDPRYENFEEGDYSNLDWCNDNYEGEWEEVYTWIR